MHFSHKHSSSFEQLNNYNNVSIAYLFLSFPNKVPPPSHVAQNGLKPPIPLLSVLDIGISCTHCLGQLLGNDYYCFPFSYKNVDYKNQ